jgi:hypothetical protein
MEAEIGTNGSERKRRLAVGRKDADKQEQIIELDEIKSSVPELVLLYKAAEDSANALSDSIKHVAERGGVLAATLRKFVAAAAVDRFDEKKRQCEQLSLLFENIEG